jgi:hypothetical protein
LLALSTAMSRLTSEIVRALELHRALSAAVASTGLLPKAPTLPPPSMVREQ